jgi:hypothetical protein
MSYGFERCSSFAAGTEVVVVVMVVVVVAVAVVLVVAAIIKTDLLKSSKHLVF